MSSAAEAQIVMLRTLTGIAGGPVALRDRILHLLECEKEVDAAWAMILRGYGEGIESREQLEAEARTNGFRYGLAQAVHHMWKRDPKMDVLLAALRYYVDTADGGVARAAIDTVEKP